MLTPCQTALHPEDRWFSVWLFLPLATCFSFLKTLRNRFTPLSFSCLIISRVRIKVLLMTLKGIRFAPRDPHQRLTPPSLPPSFACPFICLLYFFSFLWRQHLYVLYNILQVLCLEILSTHGIILKITRKTIHFVANF